MQINYQILGRELKIAITGNIACAYDVQLEFPDAWAHGDIKKISVSCAGVKSWDNSLVVILSRIVAVSATRGVHVRFSGVPAGAMRMLEMVRRPNTVAIAQMEIPMTPIEKLGDDGLRFAHALRRVWGFMGHVGGAIGRMIRGVAQMRRVDLLSAIEDVGPRAILIVSVVSFLIGLILAFVGAAQLKLFGAQIYVASLVAIASIRIMGAMMTGIIMAGRTGASYAATIGTMQVNEELDALDTMGINKTDFLVLPRLIALAITMPILTLLADIMAILGGAFIGVVMMGIPGGEYFSYTFDALGIQNFAVGILHGFVYGITIALCGCYYGINCGRNANAVGVATTRAVVSSIVWMVIATGIITFIFEVIGI